ncbi:MAG: UDP-N-acetylmuramoyl-L-alanine--D-glutamate ligase [Candidatus Saccharimonadales bacterium]
MRIAIAGYGIEGEANYRYWNTPDNELVIVDEHGTTGRPLPDDAQTMLGAGVFGRLQGFDMVVRTASLSPRKLATGGKIWSATNEFFAKCPAPIIGVTGTKGKGTTSSLIASILRAAGKTVHLVGNIGTPALDVLPSIQPSDIVVYELSSFQLWDIAKSPQTAVILLIEPDHLDVHEDMNDYVRAKQNIRRYQTAHDVCIYHPTNQLSDEAAHVSNVNRPIRYEVAGEGVYVQDGYFVQGEQRMCPVSDLQLIGQHNIENACAAITVALHHGASPDEIAQGLRDCTGLPHRLEFVVERGGVSYYNDSFSSAPAATIAALRSFAQPEVLIVGGVDRGADTADLHKAIRTAGNVKKVVLIGEIRHKLADVLSDVDTYVSSATTMQQVVQDAAQFAETGDVVVLSPGYASFDMFKNFYDRGDQFRQVVEAM